MPPRLPNVIRVGPHRYTVRSDAVRIAKLSMEQQAKLMGFSDHRLLAIDVDPAQAADQKADTLLHETLHAVFNMTDLSGEWSAEVEERIVSRLTPALLELMRRNPRLVAYITAEEA